MTLVYEMSRTSPPGEISQHVPRGRPSSCGVFDIDLTARVSFDSFERQPATALCTRIEASYAFRADNKIDPALRERIAVSLGYAAKDAEKIPKTANIGEGRGNPLSIACLKQVSSRAYQGL